MRFSDSISGLFFVGLGVAMFLIARQFPQFGGTAYGAALLPSILAIALMIAGVLLLLRDQAARVAGAPHASIPEDLRSRRGLLPAALVLLLTLGQIVLADAIGFLPVSIVGLTLLFASLRVNWFAAVGYAVVASFACWWLFAGFLRVPLPRGLLEGVI